MTTKTTRGRVLFAHVATTVDQARQDCDDYREDRRNKGQWHVRAYARHVRAGTATIPCWAVVVREKPKKEPTA